MHAFTEATMENFNDLGLGSWEYQEIIDDWDKIQKELLEELKKQAILIKGYESEA